MTALLLQLSPAWGQYLFTTLDKSDGLSSKEIYGMYGDSTGFLWFGTPNGLNRYDGSRFKLFTPYSSATPGLINEEIGAITEHGRGKLWVGTRTGLCYLDYARSRFVPVPIIRGKDTLRKPTIFSLQQDSRGRLWAATGKGLFFERQGVMLAASRLFPGAALLDTFGCMIYPADARAEGLYLRGDSVLHYLNCKTGEVYSSGHNPERWPIIEGRAYSELAAGPDGRIWFSRRGAGLGWFDPRTNKEYVYPAWKDKFVHTMGFDGHGRLWLSESAHHAYVMATEGRFDEIVARPGDPYSIAYPYFHGLYLDPRRNLWFATAKGASKLQAHPVLRALIPLPARPADTNFKTTLIHALVPADTVHIWLCRDGEILRMDTRTYTMQRFAMAHRGPGLIRYSDIRKIRGEWICATSEGILKLAPATGTFTRFRAQPEGWVKMARDILWVREDGSGRLWCATRNDGIYRYNDREQRWDRMSEPGKKVRSLFGFTDQRGRLWAGYGTEGAVWYDESTGRWVNPDKGKLIFNTLEKTLCTAMVEDADGSRWVTTDRKGAFRIDDRGNLLDSISIRDGLYSNSTSNVWLQPDGRIWISSSEGLQHTLTARKQLSGFALTSGISVANYAPPMLQMRDLLFTGMNGKLAVIDLEALAVRQASSPMPLLTGLRVLGKDILLTNDAPQLVLDYDRNFFSIEYSSPLHKEVQSMTYAYMLEGLDKDWVQAGRNQIASYTAVPPGNYRFLVRTTNANGEWSENVARFPITIRPPFWQKWWAVALALVFLVFIGYTYYRGRVRRRQRIQIGKAVDYFANSLHGHDSVSEICWDIARNCMSQMDLEDCVVYLRAEQRPVLIPMAAYGPKSAGGFAIHNPLEIAVGKGIVGAAALSGKAILVANTAKDPRYIPDDKRRASELAVPIIHEGEVIGVIDSEHSKRNFYNKTHLKAFTTIAAITANKIAEAKAEAEVKQKAVQLLEIQKLLAETQLMALRAQMNPHFVFNCLNSIQECIVTAKYGEASIYLNKFSKLFRMLLNNSGRGMIPLADEIEVLELYLSLEHMRFERSFEYTIDVDEALETSEILIPSMLLQPFVENALWHGLMHKEGARHLKIGFASISDDLFRCTIDDNGIGREKAKELKAAKSGSNQHQSKGMQITADRVDLLQRQGQAASMRILDKYDAQGQPAGTTIIIELSAFLTANMLL